MSTLWSFYQGSNFESTMQRYNFSLMQAIIYVKKTRKYNIFLRNLSCIANFSVYFQLNLALLFMAYIIFVLQEYINIIHYIINFRSNFFLVSPVKANSIM